ncbi:histidine-rich glycoprotein [Dipodomys merriami]|uniref:histidine-rich glycoprotein n=1 Tax=Dipodomys merriami TaxID=94247 RepID=UPI003855C6D0
MKVLTIALLLTILQCSCAVNPINCNDTQPVAEKVLDLINKDRWKGYLFQLLRVADAYLDREGSATVYYLVLDVKESDCWVLFRTHWDDCVPASRSPSDIVIGRCKVKATKHSNESQELQVNDYNCTISSVASALSNNKDSPVLIDFFEDTDVYRKQADKALDEYQKQNHDFSSFRVDQVERVARVRGGERTNYYVDFSVRTCSTHHFPRQPNVFGFCRTVFSYNVEASDLETPEHLDVNCEVFSFEEHANVSDVGPHPGHPHHFGGHNHPHAGKHSFKSSGSREHHHPPRPHKHGYLTPPEEHHNSNGSALQEGTPPPWPPRGSKCHHFPFDTNDTHIPPHNQSSSKLHEQNPHGHHPHGHGPHGHGPHGHGPHGHGPHKHGPHRHGPHGHGPHGHGPHGHGPHRHGPHGRHPHGRHPHGRHPHGHHPHGSDDFHDHEPCDPPPHRQDFPGHRCHGHGPLHGHSGERSEGKGNLPFHRPQIGYVYRLPPLNINEVLPSPEANFPNFSPSNCTCHSQPKIQPFPQLASESCPGNFKSEFSHIAKFF